MKLRFLVAAGPREARDRLSGMIKAQNEITIVEAHAKRQLSVWIETGTPVINDRSGRAFAIGRVFDRSAAKELAALPDWPSLQRIIVRDFWGPYVLFTSDGTGHSVLRDPSGSIPVYHGAAGALQLYASDADMLAMAWPGPFRPDLDAVRHWLKFPFLRTSRTGATGVGELPPGMARDVTRDGAQLRQRWFPQSYCTSDKAITDFDEAATVLRAEILKSVPMFALNQSNVVLQLSGGVDSSIVAIALARAGTRFRAINFATRSPEGDERSHARRIARHCGIELEELAETDASPSTPFVTTPFQRPPTAPLQALRLAQNAAAGADALVLDGGGGDNVFASISSAVPAVDAFRRQGIAQALRTLRNVSARHDCTFWSAARSALRRARRNRMVEWMPDTSFLPSSSSPRVPSPHPWLSANEDILPGSADHLRMIVGVYHFLPEPSAVQPCNLHPLISQPIIELCLRIPSWLWLEGGRDRAVARAAFRTILPDEILDRRGKGSLQSLFVKSLAGNRAELRNYLVEGRLAHSGIIDMGAVAAYLDMSDEPRDARCIRIFEIAAAEQWLRSFG